MKGLFDFGNKRDNKPVQNAVGTNAKENAQPADFTFSVCDTFRLQNSDDLVAVGRLKGTLRVKDAVYVSNPGEDAVPTALAIVAAMEKPDAGGQFAQVPSATDEQVSVRIENGVKITIKPGTVFHSRVTSVADVHSAYVNGIGDAYVGRKQCVLTREDLAVMSITDLAETWRLLNFVLSKQTGLPKEVFQESYEKIGVMARAMIEKLYALDHIYAVYNKMTGEPHLYSKTFRREDGCECTPPDIMVVTEAYQEAYVNGYKDSPYELKKIENGENKKGIHDFLEYCFFMNGAQGVAFLFQEVAVGCEQFMKKPDHSGMKEVDIPIANPDVERWQLLMGQLGEPKSADEKMIYALYYKFFSQAFLKGKYLVPMGFPDGTPIPEGAAETGKVTFEKGKSFYLAVQEGKNGRKAMAFYTDWKRLRMVYDESWSGLVQTADALIDDYDILLNVTQYAEAGSYISKEMYEGMKEKEGQ